MTDAERQRRRRKRLKKEAVKLGRKALREKKLAKEGKEYIPTPPGITYYTKMLLSDGSNREVWAPKTRPLAAMNWGEVSDDDLRELIRAATQELAYRRGESASRPGGGISVFGDAFGEAGGNKVAQRTHFKDVLRALMEESGVNAASLAKTCRVPANAVSRWLSGQAEGLPSHAKLAEVARALGVDAAVFNMCNDIAGEAPLFERPAP